MKIAIVHDYLIDFGGAERVLLSLHKIYPDAPIYVLIDRNKNLGHFSNKFSGAKIIQSWFGSIPGAEKLISPLRFLIPFIWKSVNLKEYDLIISSASWAITKGFVNNKKSLRPGGPPAQREICYCHTPPRYLYGYDTSRRFSGFFGKLVKIYGSLVNKNLRKFDFERAQKVDYFIANSKEIAGRIKKFYKRDSIVIYPPVEIAKSEEGKVKKENYFLAGGRLTAAKNFDLVIKAFNKLGLNLIVYGDGPQKDYLKSLAKNNIQFVGEVPDEEVTRLYSRAKGYIVAQKDEDFGITPVEAMGQGTPVIAYRGGGYLESVVEGKTGIFFDELSVESLSKVIKYFNDSNHQSITAENCINQAKKFSSARFEKEIKEFINSVCSK
jgi:glycosyltransferase involved in cell wall biosynthesis